MTMTFISCQHRGAFWARSSVETLQRYGSSKHYSGMGHRNTTAVWVIETLQRYGSSKHYKTPLVRFSAYWVRETYLAAARLTHVSVVAINGQDKQFVLQCHYHLRRRRHYRWWPGAGALTSHFYKGRFFIRECQVSHFNIDAFTDQFVVCLSLFPSVFLTERRCPQDGGSSSQLLEGVSFDTPVELPFQFFC